MGQVKPIHIWIFSFILLAGFHILVFGSFLDWGTNSVLFCVNLFALFNGIVYSKSFSNSKLTIYILGYFLLFLFLFVFAEAPLLFCLFAILYSALFRLPYLLGYLLILVLSVIVITPYWLQSFIILSLLYAVVFQVYSKGGERFQALWFSLGFLLLIAVVFPILYLALQSSPQTLIVTAKEHEFQRSLIVSLATSTIATLIVLIFGVPLAYAMVRLEFAGKRTLDSLIDLPILIPQTVAGIALLVLMGPKTPVGEFLQSHFGITMAGSYLGIIACQIFVSSPFLIRSAMNAFEEIGPQIENVSRTLGASPLSTFFRISLPLAGGAIFNGCILAWSRAISEVGSLMVLAYHPFTIPIFIYDNFIQYGLEEARPIAILLVIVCLWLFICLRWLRYQPLRISFRRAV